MEERERVEKVVHLGEMVRTPGRRVVLLFYVRVLRLHLFLLRKAWRAPQDVLDHVRRVRDVEGREGQGLGLSDVGVWACTGSAGVVAAKSSSQTSWRVVGRE